MPTHDELFVVLRTIDDPEMPINIVDLGLIEDVSTYDDADGQTVAITVLPTFVGCPALDMIRDLIAKAIGAMPDVRTVRVDFVYAPAWSVDRITDAGRAALQSHGVTVPERGGCGFSGHADGDGPSQVGQSTVTIRTSAVPCPFCSSSETEMDSPFGPTRCRSIFYCRACKNTFEHLKRL